MKRKIIALTISILLLTSCGKVGFDIQKEKEQKIAEEKEKQEKEEIERKEKEQKIAEEKEKQEKEEIERKEKELKKPKYIKGMEVIHNKFLKNISPKDFNKNIVYENIQIVSCSINEIKFDKNAINVLKNFKDFEKNEFKENQNYYMIEISFMSSGITKSTNTLCNDLFLTSALELKSKSGIVAKKPLAFIGDFEDGFFKKTKPISHNIINAYARFVFDEKIGLSDLTNLKLILEDRTGEDDIIIKIEK